MVSCTFFNSELLPDLCFRYHGKCLKIARGKVKEDDKYTCPICDHRVKIPRDAARPKLEELIEWFHEIPSLPFVPDEKECLESIIHTALQFRTYISPYLHNPGASQAEVPTMRFYLRKIEGAEILLATETNYFRTELHRWMPIAPDPPPVIDCSVSTRKPRPTKQQKLMAQYGVNSPDDLPVPLRTKAHTFKKKSLELNKPAHIKPAPDKNGSNPPSTSISPEQLHASHENNAHHPRFDYGNNYGVSSSGDMSSRFHHDPSASMITSPIMINPLQNLMGVDATLLDAYNTHNHTLNHLDNQEMDHSDARENAEVNHIFETLTNQDAGDLYIKDPESSPATANCLTESAQDAVYRSSSLALEHPDHSNNSSANSMKLFVEDSVMADN